MLRLFIAIKIPGKSKKDILSIIDTLKKSETNTAWTQKNNLHITLKFLGEIEEETLPDIKQALSETAKQYRQFKMNLNKLSFFKSTKKPVILYLTGENITGITKIAHTLFYNIALLNLDSDKIQKYTPHLTLGKIKDKNSLILLTEEIANLKINIPLEIDNISLFSSVLSEKGAKHTELFSAQLNKT
ncbi:MAG: RNA 2',3'-cyclic phosphodiesterase [Candidatus Omnitrophica bacterium]|nr:RNA 2',3'-cyclic phosphodiesterase [Candidatus Omnitrophota bacterium]MDD5080993.1 RNA 2',3'-cyclic phosphodiesterase [Candidatus Omnitrophota bacterium]